ncbi:MAG: sigma-70 family RNA polymerase sigma factor [Planctomycetota bacterium]|nr:sigma-70 family RNA polymerase sigma factor [Planctomycetota bacterium]
MTASEPGSPRFTTTRWSLVARASTPSPAADIAFGELLECYWYPLYAFLRRSGLEDADACDAVQGFMLQALQGGRWKGASEDRGRFRSYLLGALKHFIANEARHARAARRGGNQTHVTLDFARGEQRWSAAPAEAETPEAAFERAWARELVARARARLADETRARGRGRLHDELEDTLDGGDGSRSHAVRAAALGTTEGAIKVAVHRLRRRLAELVREEVAQTVAGASDVEAELNLLFTALGGDENFAPGA